MEAAQERLGREKSEGPVHALPTIVSEKEALDLGKFARGDENRADAGADDTFQIRTESAGRVAGTMSALAENEEVGFFLEPRDGLNQLAVPLLDGETGDPGGRELPLGSGEDLLALLAGQTVLPFLAVDQFMEQGRSGIDTDVAAQVDTLGSLAVRVEHVEDMDRGIEPLCGPGREFIDTAGVG
jgi:hypothetical protein